MKYDEDIEHIYLDDEDDHLVKSHAHHTVSAVESREEYKKLKYLLLGILIVSSLLAFIRGITVNRFVADFMAVFFITFAAFKFVDIESFVRAYRSYDAVAQRIRPWAYTLPFVEAFMGFWYLLSEGPINLNILAIIITSTAFIGASREVRRKSRFRSTYFGTLIRLPISRVSLIGNAIMFVMALVMIFV